MSSSSKSNNKFKLVKKDEETDYFYCANCMVSQGINKDFKKYYSSEGGEKVTISKALSRIFLQECQRSNESPTSDDGEDEKIKLCSSCDELFVDLYKIYMRFIDRCRVESLIFSTYFEGYHSRVRSRASRKSTNHRYDSKMQNYDSSSCLPDLNDESKISEEKVKIEVDDDYLDTEETSLCSLEKVFDPQMDCSYDDDGGVIGGFIIIPDTDNMMITNSMNEKIKRGRPRKNHQTLIIKPKRKRGRPRKLKLESTLAENVAEEKSVNDQCSKSFVSKRSRRVAKSSTNAIFLCDEDNSEIDTSFTEENYFSEDFFDPDNKVENNSTQKKKECSDSKLNNSESPSPSPIRKREYKTNSLNRFSKLTKINRSTTTTTLLNFDKSSSKVYKCPEPGCEKEAKSQWNLGLHIKCVHEKNKPFVCLTCNKRFFSKHSLGIHTSRMHQEHGGGKPVNAFVCQEPGCGRTFAYPAGLYSHKFVHKSKEDFPFSCKVCFNKFVRSCDLNDHMARHSDDRQFICERCGNKFKTKKNLGKHILIQHPSDDNRRKFSCDTCGKILKSSWNLQIHIRNIHQGLKPYRCKMCNSNFSSSSNLKVHIRSVHHENNSGATTGTYVKKTKSSKAKGTLPEIPTEVVDSADILQTPLIPIHSRAEELLDIALQNNTCQPGRKSSFTELMTSFLNS